MADARKSDSEKICFPLRDWGWVTKTLAHKIRRTVVWKTIFNSRASVIEVFDSTEKHLSNVPKQQREMVFNLLKKYMDVDLAEALDHTSLSELTTESATQSEGEIVPKGEQFVLGGMDRLIKKFKKGLDIQLNQIVKKIEYLPGSVVVATQSKTFSADTVIVTVPLGVLKNGDIEFSPPLPLGHQTAIRRVGMGLINKLILEFPRGDWLPHSEFIATDTPFSKNSQSPCRFYVNYQYYGKKPILIGMIGGEFSRRVEAMTDEKVVALAMCGC